MGGNAADDALVVVVFDFMELNGVGAFADMGGNAAAEEVVVAAFVVCPPNGVGALTDIGGNAAEDVLLGTEEVVGLACEAPKGVGALADIGGNAADDTGACTAVVVLVCKAPNGVGAFADMGGNAADDDDFAGVGALVDMGGNAAEEVELDSNEGIVFALGVTKDDGDDVCAIDDPYADGNADDKPEGIDINEDGGGWAVIGFPPLPEKPKPLLVADGPGAAESDVKDSSCLAFDATAAADGEGGSGDILTDSIVAPGKGDFGIATSFPRGAFFHRFRLTWKDVSPLLVGVVVSLFRSVKLVPLTAKNDKGNYSVYKGHCISATCYQSVEQVKILLGEMADDRMPNNAPQSRQDAQKRMASTKNRGGVSSFAIQPSFSASRAKRVGPGKLNDAFQSGKLRVSTIGLNQSTHSVVGNQGVSNIKPPTPPRNPGGGQKQPPPTNPKKPPPSLEAEYGSSSAPAQSNFKQAPNPIMATPAPPNVGSQHSRTGTNSQHSRGGGIGSQHSRGAPIGADSYHSRTPAYSSNKSAGSEESGGKAAAMPAGASLKQPPPGSVAAGAADEHPVVAQFRSTLSEGNYIKFLNDIDQKGNKPEIVMGGFGLFRHFLSRDQMARPNGVVMAGPNWIKAAMIPFERYKKHPEVIVSGLTTMTTLAGLPGPYRATMAKRSAVEVVLTVLDDYSMDESVIIAACGLINALSRDENGGLNGKHPKMAMVVNRMIALLHAPHQVGNQYALLPLRNFARQYKKLIETNRSPWMDVKDGLANEHGTNAIIRVLESHNLEPNCAEAGLTLLWKLSVPSDELDSIDMFPATEDVIRSITRCMEHFNAYGVVLQGSRTLANLALRISFPSKCAAPAIAPVKQFLRENPRQIDEEMAICAVHSFCNFSANTASRTAITTNAEAMKMTLSLISKFPDIPAIVEVGCLSVAYACAHDIRTKHSVLELGGLEIVSDAWVEHLESGEHEMNFEVKDSIFSAIASLSGCARGALQIKQAPLLNSVQRALSVEMDPDFRMALEVIVRNTNAVSSDDKSSEVKSAPKTQLHQQPNMFSQMLQNANNEQSAVALLKDLCLLGETGLMCYNNDGFDELTSMMSQMSNSEEVQEYGCKALAIAFYYLPFTNIESPIQLPQGGWAVVYQRQTMDCLQNAIRIHQNSVSVQRHAFRALINFVAPVCELDEQAVDRVGIGQWLEACLNDVLEAMNENLADIALQKVGLELFWIIFSTVSSEVLQRFKMRALQQIFDTTRQMRDNDEVLKLACDTLMALENDPESLNFMGESIIVQLLDSLMSPDFDLVERTSSVLAILLKNVFIASGHAMQYPNVTDHLVSCMGSNRSNCKILINMCSSLESLINFEDESLRAKIALDGGVEALSDALRTHGSDARLVEFDCRVLFLIIPSSCNLVSSMRNMLSIPLTEVLHTHMKNPDAEAAAMDALWTCCGQDDYFKNELMRQESLTAIIQVMERLLGSAEVQRAGCSLLGVLSSHGSRGKETIGGFGGGAAVVNALLAHTQSSSVQKEGLSALKNLASATENKQVIEQAGGEEAVLYALWTHYKNPQVVSNAYSALNNIAVDSSTKAVKLMNEKTFENCSSAMKRFSKDEGVQKNVSVYLKSCSYLPENLKLMKKYVGKLVFSLQIAAKNFPEHCGDRANSVIVKLQQ
ncbi:MAG: hypothetical protein SGBAC_008481 [Bacillariaceae sp.]